MVRGVVPNQVLCQGWSLKIALKVVAEKAGARGFELEAFWRRLSRQPKS
jgi:hypothetical protein